MRDEFYNRDGMFGTSLDTLELPVYKAVWSGQSPLIFTDKVALAVQAVNDLEIFCRQQGISLKGLAMDKATEESEAIAVAYPMARTLVQWFRDQHDETNAEKVNIRLSDFHNLRDQEAVGRLRDVRDLAQGIVESDDTATVELAEKYGITAAKVEIVNKEVEDYASAVNAPQTGIAGRKSLTTQLRARFNAVEALFVALDNLILNFDDTAEGRALIAAYQAARVVRDLGAGPHTETAPAEPAPAA